MFAQLTHKPVIRLVAAAIVLIFAGVFDASLAFARIMNNTIDPVAVVAGAVRHLIVTGPIECTLDESADLPVTVTQRTTGAVAEGTATFNCAGVIEQSEVHAATHSKSTFEEGPATGVGLAETTSR